MKTIYLSVGRSVGRSIGVCAQCGASSKGIIEAMTAADREKESHYLLLLNKFFCYSLAQNVHGRNGRMGTGHLYVRCTYIGIAVHFRVTFQFCFSKIT